jgi:hypothetical protein
MLPLVPLDGCALSQSGSKLTPRVACLGMAASSKGIFQTTCMHGALPMVQEHSSIAAFEYFKYSLSEFAIAIRL